MVFPFCRFETSRPHATVHVYFRCFRLYMFTSTPSFWWYSLRLSETISQNFPSQCAVNCLFISVILFAILSYEEFLFFFQYFFLATFQPFYRLIIYCQGIVAFYFVGFSYALVRTDIRSKYHVNGLKSIYFDIFRINLYRLFFSVFFYNKMISFAWSLM